MSKLAVDRLIGGLALILSIWGIVHVARQPAIHFWSPMDDFRKQCSGDEECAQKLEAKRRADVDAEIDRGIKAAIAKQDELKRSR